jgi:hypothetical protein
MATYTQIDPTQQLDAFKAEPMMMRFWREGPQEVRRVATHARVASRHW